MQYGIYIYLIRVWGGLTNLVRLKHCVLALFAMKGIIYDILCLFIVEPESEAIHQYLIGCQQILGLKQSLDNLRAEVDTAPKIPFNQVLLVRV